MCPIRLRLAWMPCVLSSLATLAAAGPPMPAPKAPAATTTRIPFVVGLTVVRATSDPRGDYEGLRVIDAVSPAGYDVAIAGEAPADSGSGTVDINVVRRVLAQDQRDACKVRIFFHTGDAEQFTGTVPGFSAAMLADLRTTGRADLTYFDVGVLFGMSVVKHELSGTITRVKGAARTMTVLVNGRRRQLPVIQAKGRLADAAGGGEFEFHVLDDSANPILLRSRGPGFSSNVVKIEYPEPAASAHNIENELAAGRKAEVYGIYFAFARADLRPQSEIVLREIAAALKQHPDWTLHINGHTDGVGSDASNLDLSRRRAAAVKAALVDRHGIDADRLATDGSGESQPKADNGTPEGRALNRRVELTRP